MDDWNSPPIVTEFQDLQASAACDVAARKKFAGFAPQSICLCLGMPGYRPVLVGSAPEKVCESLTTATFTTFVRTTIFVFFLLNQHQQLVQMPTNSHRLFLTLASSFKIYPDIRSISWMSIQKETSCFRGLASVSQEYSRTSLS